MDKMGQFVNPGSECVKVKALVFECLIFLNVAREEI